MMAGHVQQFAYINVAQINLGSHVHLFNISNNYELLFVTPSATKDHYYESMSVRLFIFTT